MASITVFRHLRAARPVEEQRAAARRPRRARAGKWRERRRRRGCGHVGSSPRSVARPRPRLVYDRAMQRQTPDRNLALELVRVTEGAALSAARWVGRGDKNAADQAAVDAMRHMMRHGQHGRHRRHRRGREGRGADALQRRAHRRRLRPEVDIAVDPLEGTTLSAQGPAQRARVRRPLRARHDVRPRAVLLHGEDGRRRRHRRPALARRPDRGRAARASPSAAACTSATSWWSCSTGRATPR